MQTSPPNSQLLQDSYLSLQSNKENLHYHNTWDGSLDRYETKIDMSQTADEKFFENSSVLYKQESTIEAASLKSDDNLIKLLPCGSQSVDVSLDHSNHRTQGECKQIRKNNRKEAHKTDVKTYNFSNRHNRALSTSISSKSFHKDDYLDRNESQTRNLNYSSNFHPSDRKDPEKCKTKDQKNSPKQTYDSKDEKRTLSTLEEQSQVLQSEPLVETYKREINSFKTNDTCDSKRPSDSKRPPDSSSQFLKSHSKQLLNSMESCEIRSRNTRESFHEPHSTQKRYQSTRLEDNSISCKEIDFLKRGLMSLEQENYSLRKDYEEAMANIEILKEQNEKKNANIKTITHENCILQKRIEAQDQSLNDLKMHAASIELCNKNLRNDSLQQIETIQFLLNQKNIEEKKQIVTSQELVEISKTLKIITLENEGLKSKIKRLESLQSGFGKSSGHGSLEPIDDSANISVQDLQPSDLNSSTLLFENSKLFSREDHYRIKAQSLQSRVDLLENELNVLRTELKRRPSFQQHQKEYELKVQQLEKKLERTRSASSDNLSSGELTFYKQFIDAIRTLLDIKTSDKIIPRIQDLLNEYKLLAKFSEAVQDMVSKCLHPRLCQGQPTMKQAWRFLKEILQEYVNTKSNQTSESALKQTVDKISGFLHTKNMNEIWPKIKYLVEENNRMALIISKFRSLNNFEPIPLSQLEKSLDDQLNYKCKARYSFK